MWQHTKQWWLGRCVTWPRHWFGLVWCHINSHMCETLRETEREREREQVIYSIFLLRSLQSARPGRPLSEMATGPGQASRQPQQLQVVQLSIDCKSKWPVHRVTDPGTAVSASSKVTALPATRWQSHDLSHFFSHFSIVIEKHWTIIIWETAGSYRGQLQKFK